MHATVYTWESGDNEQKSVVFYHQGLELTPSGSQASVFTEPPWWPLLLSFNHPDVILFPSVIHDQTSHDIFSFPSEIKCVYLLCEFFSLHLGNSPLKLPLSIQPLRSSGVTRVSSSSVSENICYLRSERFHPLYFPCSFI